MIPGDRVKWTNAYGQIERGELLRFENRAPGVSRIWVRMDTIGGHPRRKPADVWFGDHERERLSTDGEWPAQGGGR